MIGDSSIFFMNRLIPNFIFYSENYTPSALASIEREARYLPALVNKVLPNLNRTPTTKWKAIVIGATWIESAGTWN
jgi:hypothetical protein